MTICKEEATVLEALVSADVSERERLRAMHHAESCPECGELRELHEQLGALQVPEPDLRELGILRREVLDTLRYDGAAEVPRLRSRWSWIDAGMTRSLPRMAAATVVLAIIAAASFVVGRGTAPKLDDGLDRLSIARQVEYAAARAGEIDSEAGSPFEYSNVRLKALQSGMVRLSFDVATHLEVVRVQDDPLVSEVVVQSLLGRESVSTKLDAIDAAVGVEPRVRDALIASMLDDEMLAVRLRAISRLTALATTGLDPVVEEALLQVLRRDGSVQMRLVAIDCLTLNAIEPELLRTAIAEGLSEPGTAVLTRAERYFRSFS